MVCQSSAPLALTLAPRPAAPSASRNAIHSQNEVQSFRPESSDSLLAPHHIQPGNFTTSQVALSWRLYRRLFSYQNTQPLLHSSTQSFTEGDLIAMSNFACKTCVSFLRRLTDYTNSLIFQYSHPAHHLVSLSATPGPLCLPK